MASSLPPRLPEGARRRVAARALTAILALTLVALTAAWLGPWTPSTALALLVGHAVGQAVTLSWVVGALVSFDADTGTFLGSTLGLAPFRLLLVVGVLTLAAELGGLGPVPLFGAFLATHVAGQGIEAWTFSRLAAAAPAAAEDDAQPPASPGSEG